jgi:hypothetical protein
LQALEQTSGLLVLPIGERASGFGARRKKAKQFKNKRTTIMPRKPTKRTEFVLFDVIYEDGTQRSNRKVPGSVLGGLDGDAPARAFIEQQDREISEKSGLPVMPIKMIKRSGSK